MDMLIIALLGLLVIAAVVAIVLLARRPRADGGLGVIVEKLAHIEQTMPAVTGTDAISLGQAIGALTELKTQAKARQDVEQKTADAVTRLEAIIAGTPSKGLKLPNNLVVPIDSKWPATDLLEQFQNCDDPGQKQALRP